MGRCGAGVLGNPIIYLMATTPDVQTGEGADIDTTFWEKFPTLEYGLGLYTLQNSSWCV